MAHAADRRSTEERLHHIEFQDKPEGPIAAAIIAGGIGAAALGLFTTFGRGGRRRVRTRASGRRASGSPHGHGDG
jgi:hypothetical protein